MGLNLKCNITLKLKIQNKSSLNNSLERYLQKINYLIFDIIIPINFFVS